MAVSSAGVIGDFQQSKVPQRVDRRFRGRDLQHPVYCLLSIVRGTHFHRPDRASAGLWGCGDIPVRGNRRNCRSAAQLAAFRHRRPGQLDFRRHRRHGRNRRPAHHRPWRRRGPSRASDHRHVAGDGVHRARAVRPRVHPCRTRNPVRALSGYRRISRRYRVADDHGRDAGRDRSAAGVDQFRRLRQTPQSSASLRPVLIVAIILHLLLRRSKSPFVLARLCCWRRSRPLTSSCF